jgi:hypothetical protein
MNSKAGSPSLGSALFRRIRSLSREWRWAGDFSRLEKIRGVGAGRRAFLVANGPSLGAMDLSRLAGEFVCVVNMGIRAIDGGLGHADMHVVSDPNRYRRFAEEIEAIALRHPIPYRFISRRGRRRWRKLSRRAAEPFFIVPHTAKLTLSKGIPPLSEGLVTGRSVLVTAAVLLEFLGFSPIYVIGCDLDYQGEGKYFYEPGTLDLVHEADPTVAGRRAGTLEVGEDFAVLHAEFKRRGHALLNAGIGGNLSSLPRVSFSTLFPAPQ